MSGMKRVHDWLILLHAMCPPLGVRTFKLFCLKVPGTSRGAASSAVFMRCKNLLSIGAACALAACADPVHDDAVAKLGGEEAGVRPGPLHRPGQPCVLCHGNKGGESEFSLAGTVYVDAGSTTPIEDVNVTIIDSQSRQFVAHTNCAGNFFIKPEEFEPDFPIWLSLERGSVLREMETPVYRERSCSGCHSDPKSLSSAGHVYLIEDPVAEPLLPVSRCR